MNELQEKILKLKEKKGALILSHYYQPTDVQEVSDHVCDSFEMARRASDAQQRLLVICGVHFMAESAKVLSPQKKVLLPARDAGCPMADMITSEDITALRERHPGAAVVCYVNTPASVKAVCDVCCTSSSAEKIVRSLPEKKVIFVPDKNLGAYVAARVPEKEFVFFDGFCYVHDRVSAQDVLDAKRSHPGAMLLVHPECRWEVQVLADYIGSTAGIIDEALRSSGGEYIIGTEIGVVDRLRRLAPDKRFHPLINDFVCSDMKKTRLPDVLFSLETEGFEVRLDQSMIEAASLSLDRMVRMG